QVVLENGAVNSTKGRPASDRVDRGEISGGQWEDTVVGDRGVGDGGTGGERDAKTSDVELDGVRVRDAGSHTGGISAVDQGIGQAQGRCRPLAVGTYGKDSGV